MKNATLRLAVLTDLHYTGTDAVDEKSGLAYKHFNNYTHEYDIYGWSSDRKLTEIVNQLLNDYKCGRIDAVFLLGDNAMNDGNYRNFCEEHLAWQEHYVQRYGTMDDFFHGSPLNVSALVKKKYIDRLIKAGIPVFSANGNHDYCMRYKTDETGKGYLDYSAWEAMYHYKEMFGYSETEYAVRFARRDGKLIVYTNLPDVRLSEMHAEGFTSLVNDEQPSDTPLAAFIVVDPFGVKSFEKYLHFGTPSGVPVYGWACQTFRVERGNEELLRKMAKDTRDYPFAALMGHLISAAPDMYLPVVKDYKIDAVLYGDVHTEKESFHEDGTPDFCCGHYAAAYDIDTYTLYDGSPDLQYYNGRGAKNTTWGDMMRHPWNHIELSVGENDFELVRVRAPFFYENSAQDRLTFDEIAGKDPAPFPYLSPDGSYIYDENGQTVLSGAENFTTAGGDSYDCMRMGKKAFRRPRLDENGEVLRSCFYIASNGEVCDIDLSVDAVYTDIRKNHAQKSKDFVGDTNPVIEVKGGKIVRGLGWVRFSFLSDYVDENGDPVVPVTPRRTLTRHAIYGFDVPRSYYHRYCFQKKRKSKA